MQNLGSGSNRPPLKAMDFCFDSAELINRGGKPTGLLNYSYKRKLFSTAMLVDRQGIHRIFCRIRKSSTVSTNRPTGKRRTFRKMTYFATKRRPIDRSWRYVKPIQMDESDAKGIYLDENKFAMRWITPLLLSMRIKSIGKNNESWGWRAAKEKP